MIRPDTFILPNYYPFTVGTCRRDTQYNEWPSTLELPDFLGEGGEQREENASMDRQCCLLCSSQSGRSSGHTAVNDKKKEPCPTPPNPHPPPPPLGL